MMVADRIAIVNKGKIIQVGTPYEIYYHPKNLFVAYFMSEINYFEGIAEKEGEEFYRIKNNSKPLDDFFSKIHEDSKELGIKIGDSLFTSFIKDKRYKDIKHKDQVLLIVRANHMKIRLGDRLNEKKNAFKGKIVRRKFMGVFYRFEVLVSINGEDKVIVLTEPATTEIHRKFIEGLDVTVYFPKELGIIYKNPGKELINEVLKLK
jgi:ABC-type Fe3+/spermidine/putrescine transport system ATPase subunit